MFIARQNETKWSAVVTSIGNVAADTSICVKHLTSSLTLRVSFFRDHSHFCLIYGDDANGYKIEKSQANFYIRKLTVSEIVYFATESTLTKAAAIYRYTKIIPKAFPVLTGSKSWNN